jgi:predicted DNA-binding transcriptional regulator AlpA
MRNELQNVLMSAKTLDPSELPELLGELEVVRCTCFQRLAPSAPPLAPDVNLSVEEASKRLGMSKSFLYRNVDTFPFARRMGTRNIKFSSRGIDAWLAGNKRRP